MKDSDHTNNIPNIWVDADACPSVIKDMLFRASHRTGVAVILVANHYLSTPPSPVINALQVPAGFDVADNEIVRRCRVGDLVITGDIPLADEVISAGCLALSPRGELFSTANIKSRLAMRDFMETMRSSGIPTQGPAPLDSKDKQRFANELDQWLRRQC